MDGQETAIRGDAKFHLIVQTLASVNISENFY